MTSGLIEILIGNAQVQAIAGLESEEESGVYKVFPVVAPQNEKEPFITLRKTSNAPTISKDCFSTLDTSAYELTTWSKAGFVKTEDMFEVCRRALETGTLVETEACDFKKIWLVNDWDWYDEKSDMFAHKGTFHASVARTL